MPRLLFFTDPARTPDPEAAIRRLPRGAGVVFRAFGRPAALDEGRRLVRVARRRGVIFLAGADAALAAALGADGIHLPERLIGRAPGLRRARPGWLITGAAHSRAALVRALAADLDAAVLSPIFASRSPSARGCLGALRFARLIGGAGLPVYALGGVNGGNARLAAGTGAAGLAAVEALAHWD